MNKKETSYMKLKKARVEKRIWYSQARIETKSLSRTLQKIAEVELICAQLEAEIREGKQNKNSEFSHQS